MRVAAGIITFNEEGRVLAVARGDNEDDWGLPFGFVEPGESWETAAIRETKEETGLTPRSLKYVYAQEAQGTWAVTFRAEVEGDPSGSDEGRAAWVDVGLLMSGSASFAAYNRGLLTVVLGQILNPPYRTRPPEAAGITMGQVHNVKFEIMREGTAHNHLLSPFTNYLTLCGRNDVEPIRVPFEHALFLRQLNVFRKDDQKDQIPAAYGFLKRDLTRMLKGARNLTSSLGQRPTGVMLIALELTMSAAELSLLPFELVWPPGGPNNELCPDEVVVIRNSRRVPIAHVEWPQLPRILFAWAAPDSKVPHEDHKKALEEALAPWCDFADPGYRGQERDKYLTIVENANMATIIETLAAAPVSKPFTHVHILAHGRGVLDESGHEDRKFGLAFHRSSNHPGVDVVDGRRLASALTSVPGRPRPSVVTIAACEGANPGDVQLSGSSVAHELHEAGVPWVVASQFPLTFRGSTIFAREIYRGLLWVEDPRIAVHRTRKTLHAQLQQGLAEMDWASMVAYGSLPQNLEAVIGRARRKQLRRAMDAAVAIADGFVEPAGDPGDVEAAHERIAGLLDDRDGLLADVDWIWFLGSVYKRLAGNAAGDPWGPPPPEDARSRARALFRIAGARYLDVYRRNRTPSALTQALSCRACAGDAIDSAPWASAWNQTSVLLDGPVNDSLRLELIRARAELQVLQPIAAPPAADAFEATLNEATHIIQQQTPNSFDLFSLRRQLVVLRRWVGQSELQRRCGALIDVLDDWGVKKRWPATVDWVQKDDRDVVRSSP